ncbi:MAG: multicopper oxidase domain-containing protein [Akkermansiaceae bacterium]
MKTIIILLLCLLAQTALSEVVTYDLYITEKTISPAGKSVRALTVNGGIPAPTLRFREGDIARITVHNQLKKEETSSHWHGLLVPNQYDGVPYLTTKPIKPGMSHTFEFELKHPGTYWYHSHTGLQEQRGVYGSIVITPKSGERIETDRDHVVVLSDWTNENPTKVMKNLMRGSEIYAVKKKNAQSILGAAKAGKLKEYFEREKSRMAAMDLSDVYYDQFWANGKTEISPKAKPGESVRLRFINAGASSYFYLSSSTGDLKIIAADGVDVVPVKVPRILIGMAETYDVIVQVPMKGRYEVRATAQDGSGHASIFLGEGKLHPASDPPLANLYTMDEMLDGAMSSMMMDEKVDRVADRMMTDKDPEVVGINMDESLMKPRPPAPYAALRSVKNTQLPSSLPLHEMELRLTGDMSRYIWSFNGKTLSEDSKIVITRGERVRFKLINDTMMHHPIHLHGHFFRLINGQGDYSPLKHTVDVPPMGRRIIEFEANEEKDWFLHCHLLYHMDAGMARVISYAEQGPDHEPNIDPKLLNFKMWMVDASIQNHMTMGMAMVMQGREDYYAMWDYGFDHHKEYEIDLGWKHYFNPNLSSVAGYRLTNEHGAEDRIFAGIEYRLLYLINSSLTADSEGNFRVDLEKEFQLTSRLSVGLDVQYDTNSALEDNFEWGAKTSYLINGSLSLTGGYESNHGWGAGIQLRF